MRHNIWEKDDFFTLNGSERIDMDPSVVELPESAPLTWQFDFTDARGFYGNVTDIRLEDGVITGEVEIYDPTWNADTIGDLNCRLGGYYTKVEKNEDGTVITSCYLRGVSIVSKIDIPFSKEN